MTLSEGKEELKEILLASPPVLFLGAGSYFSGINCGKSLLRKK